MFKKLLVPLDGSGLSEQVLPLVRELLTEGTGEATLFTVGEAPKATARRSGLRRSLPIATVGGGFPPGMIPAAPTKYVERKDQAMAREEQGLLAYLHKAGQALVETNRPIHAAVHMGEPADEIIDFANQDGTDLIVMATHGRSGFQHMLLGSVAERVVRKAPCPVLVVREGEPK